MRQILDYIDGAFTPSATGAWLDKVGPATAAVIAHIARSDGTDVDRSVAAAHRARTGPWGAWTVA